MNKFKIVIGDWSNDGHGRTDDYIISTNLSSKEIDAAYKKAVKFIGIDMVEELCRDYNGDITKEQIEIFAAHGIEIEEYMDRDTFLWLWGEYIKLGNSDFEYKMAEDVESIEIGGYGLF